jgi:hypothetical protein
MGNNLYASPNIIRVIKRRRMRWTGHEPRMGQMRNEYKILVGMYGGRSPFGTPTRTSDDIRMDLREQRLEVTEWMQLAQERDEINLRVS